MPSTGLKNKNSVLQSTIISRKQFEKITTVSYSPEKKKYSMSSKGLRSIVHGASRKIKAEIMAIIYRKYHTCIERIMLKQLVTLLSNASDSVVKNKMQYFCV